MTKIFSKLKSVGHCLKTAVLLCLLSLLTQCSTLPELSLNPPSVVAAEKRPVVWEQNQQALNQVRLQRNWTMLARVGIVSKDGSSSSQLDWVNTSQTGYRITLNNMLTFGQIIINKNKNKVTLTYQDKTHSASNPEQLLLKLTGLKLPVSQLEYWFLGLPSPNLAVTNFELNEFAYLKQLKQAGYNITYDDYSRVNNLYLPHKIIIKSPQVYIKVNVQTWNLKT